MSSHFKLCHLVLFISLFRVLLSGRENCVASPGVRSCETDPRAYILLLLCTFSGLCKLFSSNFIQFRVGLWFEITTIFIGVLSLSSLLNETRNSEI